MVHTRGARVPDGRFAAFRRAMGRHRWLAIGVVVAAWGITGGVLGLLGLHDLRAGRAAVERARAHLDVADLHNGRAAAALSAADRAFRRGRGHLGSPVLAPIKVAPVLGRQLRSAIALADAAHRIAAAGATATSAAGAALDHPPHTGAERIALVRRLATVARTASEAISTVDLGPPRALFPPLRKSRAKLALDLARAQDTLTRAATVSAAMVTFLDGPRDYLVLAANNAEMRAGSGMFLSGGILHLEHGEVALSEMQPVGQLQPPGDGVEVGGDQEALWGWTHPGREWRNLGMTPQFDQTGPLAARMWEARFGQRVDGVLALDVPALRALLTATGPVTVGTTQVGADGVERLLYHDQYVAIRYDRTLDQVQADRREQLGAIARAAVDVVQGGTVGLTALGSELGRAAAARHVLLWAAKDDEQAAWRAAGVSGQLSKDSMLVSMLNRSGNKLDQYLAIDATLTWRAVRDGVRVETRLVLRNGTPPNEPQYVAGPRPDTDVPEGGYRGLLSVSLPADARAISFNGLPLVAAGRDGPTRVIATELELLRDAHQTVVLKFTLPIGTKQVIVEPSARRPPTTWHAGRDAWDDGSRHTIGLTQ